MGRSVCDPATCAQTNRRILCRKRRCDLRLGRGRIMKENVFDILVYLFENYMDTDGEPAGNRVPDGAKPTSTAS